MVNIGPYRWGVTWLTHRSLRGGGVHGKHTGPYRGGGGGHGKHTGRYSGEGRGHGKHTGPYSGGGDGKHTGHVESKD